jgi:hypothetical protein
MCKGHILSHLVLSFLILPHLFFLFSHGALQLHPVHASVEAKSAADVDGVVCTPIYCLVPHIPLDDVCCFCSTQACHTQNSKLEASASLLCLREEEVKCRETEVEREEKKVNKEQNKS